jgi:hypothetical protein
MAGKAEVQHAHKLWVEAGCTLQMGIDARVSDAVYEELLRKKNAAYDAFMQTIEELPE